MKWKVGIVLATILVLVGFLLVNVAVAYPTGTYPVKENGQIIGWLTIFPDGSYVLADSDPGPPPMSNVVQEGELHDPFEGTSQEGQTWHSEGYMTSGIAVRIGIWLNPETGEDEFFSTIEDVEGVLGHGPGPFNLGMPL